MKLSERDREREIEKDRERERERERGSTDKISWKKMSLDFHMENLKYLCYKIQNFTFNDKLKWRKLKAAVSPVWRNLAGQNSV